MDVHSPNNDTKRLALELEPPVKYRCANDALECRPETLSTTECFISCPHQLIEVSTQALNSVSLIVNTLLC